MADNSTEAEVVEDSPGGRAAFLIVMFVYAVAVVVLGLREYCMGRGPTNSRRTFPFHRRGLQPSLIKFIPAFTYSAAADPPDRLECSICLSEFEDGEQGRVLPSCRHYFHTECIDMWLRSHSNCPLCRVDVNPVPARNPGDVAVEMSELLGAQGGDLMEPPRNGGDGGRRAEIQEVGCP